MDSMRTPALDDTLTITSILRSLHDNMAALPGSTVDITRPPFWLPPCLPSFATIKRLVVSFPCASSPCPRSSRSQWACDGFFRLARFATRHVTCSHTNDMHPPAERMRTSAQSEISTHLTILRERRLWPFAPSEAPSGPCLDRPSPCFRRR